MDLLEQVKERLSVFKNLYDVVRIVDPIKKSTIIVIDDIEEEYNGKCYELWRREVFCENCISMRAYISNDTFIKIEYDKEKIILIIATPVEIEGNLVIVEILKDISENGSVSSRLAGSSELIEELVSSINETSKILSKSDKNIYKAKSNSSNRKIINETNNASISSKTIKLSRLNEEINELREVLNEVCCTTDPDETYTDRLTISQQLDELIVEYMKEMNDIK